MLIESPDLSSFPRVRHAFFTREGGVSAGLYASLNGGLGSADDAAAVATNRARMAAELGVAADGLVSLHQIHSPTAILATAPWARDDRPKADGVATATPGIALAIATADCGPVLFADAQAGVVGACHAGWQGAFRGILEATLARMEELGAQRNAIVAVLGPTIGPGSYEVGPEFVARLVEADARNRDLFRDSDRAGHAFFDLPAYIGRRMEAANVASFASLGLCTYADEARFYSYRRSTHRAEPDYGRLVSAIALTG